MTGLISSSICRPDRAESRNNRRVIRNLCGKRDARVSSNRRVSIVPSTSLLVVILLSVLEFVAVLTHQHRSLLLTVTEAEKKHENDMVFSDVIHHRSLMQPSGNQAESHRNEKHVQNLRLRYDWTNLSPSLDLTKHILNHQRNCSIPTSTFTYRNRFGLGSDLHVYSQALGFGIETNRRIRTVGYWTWMDQSECETGHTLRDGTRQKEIGLLQKPLGSPMRCYFANSELNCPGDVEYAITNPLFNLNNSLSRANGNLISRNTGFFSEEYGGMQTLQTAVLESLFTSITPLVVLEAERQLNLVFGGKDKVPKDLITVHIRWGDKVATHEGKRGIRRPEMKKVEILDYIDAINRILNKREVKNDSLPEPEGKVRIGRTNKTANIYLATEDPIAAEEFSKAIPKGWNLFVDQFLVDTKQDRINEYNGSPKMAKAQNGKAGLLALGSLLVAMEANDFVLTTASNWSSLMDKLRLAILDPRCGNCTSSIDLRPGVH